LPAVQSFRDLGALRSRITDAIRQERGPAGDPQAVRRMSMLLGHVQDAMEGRIIERAAEEAKAVDAGTLAPKDAIVQSLEQQARDFIAQRRLEAKQASAGRGANEGFVDNGQSGSSTVSSSRGTEGQTRGQSGNTTGSPGLSGPAHDVTPKWDQSSDGTLTVTVDGHTFRVVKSTGVRGSADQWVATIPATKDVVTFRGTADDLVAALRKSIAAHDPSVAEAKNSLTPNFDAEAQARYTAARQATADRAATFKTPPGVREALQGGPQAGTFRMPDTSVPAMFIRVGPEGAARVQSYLAAGGSPEALSEAAAFSLRRDAIRSDGTLDPDKYAAWSKQRSSFLSALPDAATRFGAAADAQRAAETGSAEAAQALKDAVKAAQQTVDAAVAARADQAKAVQRSVVGKFLGDADPVTRVAAVLRSPTAVADMRTLAARVANDPDAKVGLQRAVAEHILRDLKGNAAGAGGEEAFLKGDQLQTFLRTREPALREVLTPAQMTSLRSVAESLERSNLSVSGSRLAGGSDTVQNAAAGATTLLGNFMHQAVTHAGTTAGGALGFIFGGGPVGALAGAAVGRVGDWGVQAARAAGAAGMHTVDDLVANAMLHPQLAAVLLAKVTPNNRESLGRALVSQLRRISLVSAAVGRQDEDRAQKNALLR
jgi:hypothetical protein